jgi:hypothetical protein
MRGLEVYFTDKITEEKDIYHMLNRRRKALRSYILENAYSRHPQAMGASWNDGAATNVCGCFYELN